jgi:hypothetical protein
MMRSARTCPRKGIFDSKISIYPPLKLDFELQRGAYWCDHGSRLAAYTHVAISFARLLRKKHLLLLKNLDGPSTSATLVAKITSCVGKRSDLCVVIGATSTRSSFKKQVKKKKIVERQKLLRDGRGRGNLLNKWSCRHTCGGKKCDKDIE